VKLSKAQRDKLINVGIEYLVTQYVDGVESIMVKRQKPRKVSKPSKIHRRKKMTAKQRKAVSIRMKKFWASKRNG
jgi:hypothetical protein